MFPANIEALIAEVGAVSLLTAKSRAGTKTFE